MQDLLKELLTVDASPKLTLQIPAGLDAKERSLRIRHQLEATVADLEARDTAPAALEAILERAQTAADHPALVKARRGTGAVYVAGDFAASVHWPGMFAERTVVSDVFFLADVIEFVDPAHCYVLTLSKGGVHLYRADPLTVETVPLDGVPASLAAASEYLDLERQLQFHQSQSVGRGGPAVMYHGHGIGEGRDIEELRSYLRAVDHGVQAAIAGDPGPLALVGAGELPSEYQSVMSNGDLVESVDRKNPDAVGPAEVRRLADGVLSRTRAADVAALRSRMGDLIGLGRASRDVQAILGAARRGRIDTLLVGPAYGGSESAVNHAVGAVLRHRGRVVADAELTEAAPVAALFRY